MTTPHASTPSASPAAAPHGAPAPTAASMTDAGHPAPHPAPPTFSVAQLLQQRPAPAAPPLRLSLYTPKSEAPQALLDWLNTQLGGPVLTFAYTNGLHVTRYTHNISPLALSNPPAGMTMRAWAADIIDRAYVALAVDPARREGFLTAPGCANFGHLDTAAPPPGGFIVFRRRQAQTAQGRTTYLNPTHRAQWVADVVALIRATIIGSPVPTHMALVGPNAVALAYAAGSMQAVSALLFNKGVPAELHSPPSLTMEVKASFPSSVDEATAAAHLDDIVRHIASAHIGATVIPGLTAPDSSVTAERFTISQTIKLPPDRTYNPESFEDRGATFTTTIKSLPPPPAVLPPPPVPVIVAGAPPSRKRRR